MERVSGAIANRVTSYTVGARFAWGLYGIESWDREIVKSSNREGEKIWSRKVPSLFSAPGLYFMFGSL